MFWAFIALIRAKIGSPSKLIGPLLLFDETCAPAGGEAVWFGPVCPTVGIAGWFCDNPNSSYGSVGPDLGDVGVVPGWVVVGGAPLVVVAKACSNWFCDTFAFPEYWFTFGAGPYRYGFCAT
jgi:hypothetical protein